MAKPGSSEFPTLPPVHIAFTESSIDPHSDTTAGVNSPGWRVENFTRVETFGDNANDNTLTNDVHWLKVLVDPDSHEVFSYQPQIVPANGVAVSAP